MLRLIKVEISKGIVYPSETVFITTTFQAECDFPFDKPMEIFCDLDFGYMSLLEGCQKNYRVKGDFYPQPMHLKCGETITNTIRWNIPSNAYGGSYRIKIGICDFNAVPYSINVDDKVYKRYYVGDIEVAFHDCAPKFVNSHNEKLNFCFSQKENISYKKEHEMEIYIRDLNTDSVLVERSKPKFVDFDLNYKDGTIVLDNVTEQAGYELLSVKFPTLISIPCAKIISTAGGGRFIDSNDTICFGYEKKFQQKNLGILFDGKEYIMLEAPYMDECIHYSVYERNGVRYGAVGITLTYRIRKYGHDSSIKVINRPTANVMRTKDLKEILSFVRGDLKRPNEFYDRGILYYFEIDCDGHEEKHTFLQALDRVKSLYHMTGGVKQIMLLRGFQHDGHDTGYPDVFTLNKRAGNMEELNYVINEAKKYNAIITFHDNYDDLYEELPAYDGEIVAFDEYNLPYKGWIWVSGLSRIISAPKYVKSGKMAKRVEKTLNMYPVKDSYHLDVLSCEARRYDFDENVRAAAEEFVEYKRQIIREFQKYGFNVTSEGVSIPFAGVIGHAWTISVNGVETYPNEKFYPLIGMIFHSILPYSSHLDLYSVLSGAEVVPEISGEPNGYYKEQFYLYTLPMGMLYDKTIDAYDEKDNIYRVSYSDDSAVIYNKNTNEITVMNENQYLTKDGNTLVKGYENGEYLGYTKNGNYAFELPFSYKIKTIFEIDFDGEREEISYELNENILMIKTREDTAFKIILDK